MILRRIIMYFMQCDTISIKSINSHVFRQICSNFSHCNFQYLLIPFLAPLKLLLNQNCVAIVKNALLFFEKYFRWTILVNTYQNVTYNFNLHWNRYFSMLTTINQIISFQDCQFFVVLKTHWRVNIKNHQVFFFFFT